MRAFGEYVTFGAVMVACALFGSGCAALGFEEACNEETYGATICDDNRSRGEQAQFLASHGKPCMQGFLFCRPMPLGELISQLETALPSHHQNISNTVTVSR